jgi:exosortase A-associated hydrolase 2
MPAASRLQGFHITSSAGNLAAIYRRPNDDIRHVEDLLFIHGFGHELFNARPVAAYVWRRLATEGIGVLSIDLPGCGDSDGDFGDATWEKWLSSVEAAHGWLAEQSDRPLNIGGLRIGAALALESAESIGWKRLVLLQPVLSGEEMMTQFLRLRVAFSGLRDVPAARETTQDLRERIAKGEKLEIAGYFLAPELAVSIDAINLSSRRPTGDSPIYWVETATGSNSVAVQDTVAAWRKAGVGVTLSHVDVKPYWVHTRGNAGEYDALANDVAGIFRKRGA